MTYFGAGVRDTDIAARVTLLGKLASEEVVELGLEDTVGYELALLANLARHLDVWWLERDEEWCEPRASHPERQKRIQPIYRLRSSSVSTIWRCALARGIIPTFWA